MKKSHFTLAVAGRGMLLGPFITEAFNAFPNVKIFDRTAAFKKAVAGEADIARSGHMCPHDVPAALRAEKNMKNPPKADVTVTFAGKGYNQDVTVDGRRRDRNFSFNLSDASMKQFDKCLDKIIRAVERTL